LQITGQELTSRTEFEIQNPVNAYSQLVQFDDPESWRVFLLKLKMRACEEKLTADRAGDVYKFSRRLDVVDQVEIANNTSHGNLWAVFPQWEIDNLILDDIQQGFFLPGLAGGYLFPVLDVGEIEPEAIYVAGKSWLKSAKEYGETYVDWLRFICPRCFWDYWQNDAAEIWDQDCFNSNCFVCDGVGDISFEYNETLPAPG
jgi:hypothetical protein